MTLGALAKNAVISGVYGAYFEILLEENPLGGERLLARPAGRLRLKGKDVSDTPLQDRHRLAIGDRVMVTEDAPDKNQKVFRIEEALPRKNQYTRASYSRLQTLGANLDGVLIWGSVVAPPLNIPFIERALCEAILSGIEPIVIFNKQDLLRAKTPAAKEQHEWMERWYHIYTDLGFSVFRESFQETVSDALKEKIKEGVWLLVGQSGTGKSTFLNLYLGEARQAVADVASKTGKGKHTTVNPVMIPVTNDVFLIDCPGVREFGLAHRGKNEIKQGFPEFARFSCRYVDCSHTIDSGCEVKKATEEGLIDPLRFSSYLSLLEDFEEKYKPRRGDFRISD